MAEKIYQIEVIDKKGQIDIPKGLFSFQVFKSKADAEKWIREHPESLNGQPYKIVDYSFTDIEEYSVVEV